jgi:hypothetical protein
MVTSSILAVVGKLPERFSNSVSSHSSIASRMLLMASDSVRPWLTQPGKAGHYATIQSSSPCSRTTLTVILNCSSF